MVKFKIMSLAMWEQKKNMATSSNGVELLIQVCLTQIWLVRVASDTGFLETTDSEYSKCKFSNILSVCGIHSSTVAQMDAIEKKEFNLNR